MFLKDQLLLLPQGQVPDPEKFVRPSAGWIKPENGGGLWTSTYNRDTGSGWVQWSVSEQFGEPFKEDWYLLTPDFMGKVLLIENYTDVQNLYEKYGYDNGRYGGLISLDFPKIAVEYDAIHLTEQGQWRTRLTQPYNLYGWDCESTLWLRWKFVGQPQKVGLDDIKRIEENYAVHSRIRQAMIDKLKFYYEKAPDAKQSPKATRKSVNDVLDEDLSKVSKGGSKAPSLDTGYISLDDKIEDYGKIRRRYNV